MSDCTRVEEHLVDLLEGELPHAERATLDAHLAACATCQETVRATRALLEAYRGLPEADVSAPVAERILAAARAPRVPRRRWAPLLLAAAVVLAVLVPRALRLRDAPDALAPLVREGDAQRRAGALVEATASYERALALAEGEERAGILLVLAELDLAQGRDERALERLDALLADAPDGPRRAEALLLQGETLLRLGRLAAAEASYERLVLDARGRGAEADPRIQALRGHLDAERLLEAEQAETLRALGYVGD